MSRASDDIDGEQHYISMLYGRLDDLRAQAAERLAGTLRESGSGTLQSRSQRDSTAAMYTDRVSQLNAVEHTLCFGRLDFDDAEAEPRYIGRIGIFPSVERDDQIDEPLLMDWRAPAARPFYLATAAAPDGVARRRHIRTRRRTVIGLDDEVLDLAQATTAPRGGFDGLTGEATLLAALDANRTGRMRDIVQTIQVEQDHIIRAPLGGVLVVQGGPGTGKTAVALHRAAYLLYTHRELLGSRVVLIVGPNSTFLRYISQVLPSLAETGAVLATVGDLYPGVTATRPEPAAVAEVKGRAVMASVLAAAVEDRQRVPDEPMEIVAADREPLTLTPAMVATARARARRAGRPHNLARQLFDTEIVHALAAQLGDRIGFDPYANDPLGGDDAPGVENVLDEADLAEIRRDLRADPQVQAALDSLWPILTPQELLVDLFGSADRIEAAAVRLSAADRSLLLRTHGGGWTPADVPLLDEAAELLGEDERRADAVAQRLLRERIEYAEGALEIALGSKSIDTEDEEEPELLTVTDLLDAERLAERHADGTPLTPAERAAADRTWAYGHVIVDEAQELSPMAWRLLMRRCPSRSMTLVGDVAQTGDLGGATSWGHALEPYVGQRWRLAELTVNYRTPAEVMEVAAGVLAAIDPTLEPPRSVRRTGVKPWSAALDELAEVVGREAGAVGDGRLGVIVPEGRAEEFGRAVRATVPQAAVGGQPKLDQRVVVLTVRQAKGLEFDSVVVADPAAIVAESSRGHNDLYVALTRATQRLGLVVEDPDDDQALQVSGLPPL